jgi:hypothetical protein
MADDSTKSERLGWLAGAGTLLAIIACYGTLMILSVLSLMGVSLAVHKGAWAGTIVLFSLVAVLGVAMSYRRHRQVWPLLVAAFGAGLVAWAMFGSYSRLVEIMGFAFLLTAAVWDWRIKKHDPSLWVSRGPWSR